MAFSASEFSWSRETFRQIVLVNRHPYAMKRSCGVSSVLISLKILDSFILCWIPDLGLVGVRYKFVVITF